MSWIKLLMVSSELKLVLARIIRKLLYWYFLYSNSSTWVCVRVSRPCKAILWSSNNSLCWPNEKFIMLPMPYVLFWILSNWDDIVLATSVIWFYICEVNFEGTLCLVLILHGIYSNWESGCYSLLFNLFTTQWADDFNSFTTLYMSFLNAFLYKLWHIDLVPYI